MTSLADRADPGPRVRAHHASGRGVARIGYPIEIRRVTLLRKEWITPQMLRLTVAGPELATFHTYAADDHVALVFPLPDGTRNDPVNGPDLLLEWAKPMPPVRKYTIRRYDREALELDLDFVVHDGGLAADWAAAAEPGETIAVAGPPGAKAFAHTYRHYVFAIDTTALPAVARWLEEADWLVEAGATAEVFIDHDHDSETSYPLTERPGVTVRWFSRHGGSRLAQQVIDTARPGLQAEQVFVFAAGEAGDIKPLRRWSSDQGHDSLVTGYWKRGLVGTAGPEE